MLIVWFSKSTQAVENGMKINEEFLSMLCNIIWTVDYIF